MPTQSLCMETMESELNYDNLTNVTKFVLYVESGCMHDLIMLFAILKNVMGKKSILLIFFIPN